MSQVNGNIILRDGEAEDLDAALLWKVFGLADVSEEDMFL